MPVKRCGIALLCVLSLLAPQLSAQAQPAYSHYTIEVTFDPQSHTLSGRQTIEYLNDSDYTLSAVYFLLLPNYDREPNPYLDPGLLDALYPEGFDPAWMRIDSITDGEGNALSYELMEGPAVFQTYSLADTLLRVELPHPLPPGERVELMISFTTKFPHTLRGDEGRYLGVYTWRFGWNPIAIPASELIEGEYLSEKRPYYKFLLPAALYELTLTLPSEYEAAIGADHQEMIEEGEKMRRIHAMSAVPVRSVPISLSSHFKVYEFPHPEVPILVYYLPGDEAAARLIASYAAESLDYYRKRWGEYPHRRLLIIETASPQASFSGASADALIIIDQSLFREKDLAVPSLLDRLLDYILAHEIAHQWWGIGIGADLNAENFLSESLAQYFSITYFEEKYGEFGPNVFQLEREGLLERFVESQFGYINLREHLQGELPYILAVRDRFDEAIVKPQKDVRFAHASAERLYGKGYLMLRGLRGLIGEEAMDRLLSEAHRRFLHQTLTVEEFEALAEEVSGQDLSEFFELALYRDGVEEGRAPYLDYGIERITSRKRPDGTYEHLVYLFRRGELRLPVEVVAVPRAGEEQRQVWKVEDQAEKSYVMVFDSAGPLKWVRIDPKGMTPDIDRLNNYYVTGELALFNRKVVFIPTGENALPLDAYLIRFNPLGQTLEGGYLLDHRWWLGQGYAAFVKDLGRGSSLSAVAGVTEAGLIGELSWQKTFYSHPELGLLGRFWEATDQLELSFLHIRDAATGRMANVLGVRWLHQESLTQRLAWWFELLNDPVAFTRIELGGWKGLRIAPHIELSGQLSFGWGEGELGIFSFDLRELVSLDKASGYPFVGDVRLLGALELRLPLQRELGYNLLGVAMLHRIDERFFFRFGETWQQLEEVGQTSLSDLKAEIGFELSFKGRTFGGLFPWEVKLGIVYPLSQLAEGERVLKQYISFWMPLF
jgi:hypothetical protein